MKKLLVICGPTATGKTALGIKLAKKYNGEIVSADSRQVYKGMDIGTGKDLPKTAKLKVKSAPRSGVPLRGKKLKVKFDNNQVLKPYRFSGIPVWLLDIVEPSYQFSVVDYTKCASVVINDIWEREELPILVGGTGFYIKGVVDGIGTMGIGQDWELREQLDSLTAGQLAGLLRGLDPAKWERMDESDRKNPRRLIRAIEIAAWKLEMRSGKLDKDMGSGNSHISLQPRVSSFQRPASILFIGLTAPNKILYERIDKRVEERVKEGVIEEIGKLLKKGYGWENSALGTTIGYKEWREYFKAAKQQSSKVAEIKKEIIQKWKYNEHGYARRQRTWFRQDSRIHWFDITKKSWQNKVNKLVKEVFHF